MTRALIFEYDFKERPEELGVSHYRTVVRQAQGMQGNCRTQIRGAISEGSSHQRQAGAEAESQSNREPYQTVAEVIREGEITFPTKQVAAARTSPTATPN